MNEQENVIRDVTNYYVSEHFRYTDFLCPCCDTVKLVPGFFRHISLLERLQGETGIPVIVTSGYRCTGHNKRIGGAPRSWHMLFATDITTEAADPEELRRLFESALDIGFGGIGRYETHIHLDLRP